MRQSHLTMLSRILDPFQSGTWLMQLGKHIMTWFVERPQESDSWTGSLCERKEHAWNAPIQKGWSWEITKCSSAGIFEVISDPTHIVNISKRTCTCFTLQVQGFPCPHAVNVIRRHLPFSLTFPGQQTPASSLASSNRHTPWISCLFQHQSHLKLRDNLAVQIRSHQI